MTSPSDRAIAEVNRCDCHPETCCCQDWRVMLDGKRFISGGREECKQVAAAMNTAFDLATTPARELDAEKGGACDVPGEISVYCRINGCHAMTLPAITPPAQAAEAVERVARAVAAIARPNISFEQLSAVTTRECYRMARAAIAAMQAGE